MRAERAQPRLCRIEQSLDQRRANRLVRGENASQFVQQMLALACSHRPAVPANFTPGSAVPGDFFPARIAANRASAARTTASVGSR